MPALDVRDIFKSFGARRILDGVSVRVERGHALALLGPSGCGKTTLLRIVAGLERADAGEVWIADSCVASQRAHARPEDRGAGMVFQDLALWPHMRAWRQLEFVLRGRGKRRAERIGAARELLARFQLESRADAYPAMLSGGEQQRLALARALVTDPPLLLLDEPFANLNMALRDTVVNELERRMREQGMTIVIATHDPEEVERIASSHVQLGGAQSGQEKTAPHSEVEGGAGTGSR